MSRVAIFGCGPAGLLAAHAVRQAGHRPVIISKAIEKSPISGAQYIHEPILDLHDPDHPDGSVRFVKMGNKRGYAEKVYGDPDAPCSWDSFPEGEVSVWSMAATYDRLWEMFSESILSLEVTSEMVNDFIWLLRYPLMISTIPLWSLCHGGHAFDSQPIWISPHARFCVFDQEIVYNGVNHHGWYRSSKIFGHGATEYAGYTWWPNTGAIHKGVKPTGSDCDCNPHIVKAGRFGTWRKGVLVHHAYETASQAVAERL